MRGMQFGGRGPRRGRAGHPGRFDACSYEEKWCSVSKRASGRSQFVQPAECVEQGGRPAPAAL